MKNKIAVVTGAGGTLCSEIAIELAKEGATVFLVGRTIEKLQATAAKIKAAGGTDAILFSQISTTTLLKRTEEDF